RDRRADLPHRALRTHALPRPALHRVAVERDEKVYETFDWSHPGGTGFDPAFVLAPGDWFDYECLYDNGVSKPVRRDATGNPTALTFGVTTEDAMCILTGAYYTD